jgi:hypothetical protein
MNYTANIASGNTDKIGAEVIRCSVEAAAATGDNRSVPLPCRTPVGPLTVQVPSMLLASKGCPPPSRADFAKYPKVAVASSIRTQNLMSTYENCSQRRFSEYRRWQPPPPCPALPQSANMAGISQPSTRKCNSFTY